MWYYSKSMNKIQSSLMTVGSKINGKAIGLMSVCGVAALPVMSVFAADATPDIFESAKAIIKTIYNGVFGISTALAVVIAVIACLFMMFSSNPRTVETSKSWLKRVLIAWVIINALGLIISTLTTWLTSAGATDAGGLI